MLISSSWATIQIIHISACYNTETLNHADDANHIAMWYALLNHAALDKLFWEKHSQNLVTGLVTQFFSEIFVFAHTKKMRLIHQYDLKNWCHEPWSGRGGEKADIG